MTLTLGLLHHQMQQNSPLRQENERLLKALQEILDISSAEGPDYSSQGMGYPVYEIAKEALENCPIKIA